MPFITVRNDITKMEVDAIVNPANPYLAHGGGCCGAIHRAAGPQLLKECQQIGGCPTGEAVITGGYELPAKYVIHAVGPIWRGGDNGEEELLKSAYTSSLRLARANGCQSIAFPLISSGIYGYPREEALEAAQQAISAFLMNEDDGDMTVYMVLFDSENCSARSRLFRAIMSYIRDNSPEALFGEIPELSKSAACMPDRKLSQDRPMPSKPFGRNNAKGFGRPVTERPICPPRPAEPEPQQISGSEAPELCADECLYESDAILEDSIVLPPIDESFSEMLIRLIDSKGLKDSDVYKLANKDRKLFNKIKLNSDYHPGKQTALAFAIALKLDLNTTKELINKAGFALTHSSKGDLVVEYCITHGIYDIMKINDILFDMDLQLL